MSVRVEREGALVILTLDRPDVLNAFDESLAGELAAAVRKAADDVLVRAFAITGAGRAFSAGQDLRDRALALERGSEPRLGDELRRRYHPVVSSIRLARKPVIAAINGVVAGAGFGLAVACDLRVATAAATFHPAWLKVGLVPDAGSAFFLPRIVGWGRALDLVLRGDPVGAEEALRMGLVTRVWPDADFDREWRAYARSLADGPTEAFALTKEGLNAAWEKPFSAFLETEAMLQDRAGRTRDYGEGIRAFLAKRPPTFRGR